jgi:hypothetical protein
VWGAGYRLEELGAADDTLAVRADVELRLAS